MDASFHKVVGVAFQKVTVVPFQEVVEVVVLSEVVGVVGPEVEPYFLAMAPGWTGSWQIPVPKIIVLLYAHIHVYFIIQENFIVSFKTEWLHYKGWFTIMFSFRAVNNVDKF